MSQPEAVKKILRSDRDENFLTAIQRCRDKLIAKYGIEVVKKRNFTWSHHFPTNLETDWNRGGKPMYDVIRSPEFIPVANIIASNLLDVTRRITPPNAVRNREKIVRCIAACIFKFLKNFWPSQEKTLIADRADPSDLRFMFYEEILMRSYNGGEMSTDLFCLIASQIDFILEQCFARLLTPVPWC